MARARVWALALALTLTWVGLGGGGAAAASPPSNTRRMFVACGWTAAAATAATAVAAGTPPAAVAYERAGVMANPSGVFTDDKSDHLVPGVAPRLGACEPIQNCVATSSTTSPSKSATPWQFAAEPDAAWDALLAAVRARAEVVAMDSGTSPTARRYLRAEVASVTPPGSIDVLEFLLDPVERTVFYRSATRDTYFVYPLQTPISDNGTNRKRLDGIRAALGWAEVRTDLDLSAYGLDAGGQPSTGGLGRVGAFSLWSPKDEAEPAAL